MTEIICVLDGGLGNQMFEFAHAFALSRQYGIPLIIDLGRYRLSFSTRKAEILKLSLPSDVKTVYFHKSLRAFWMRTYINMFAYKILHRQLLSNDIVCNDNINLITGDTAVIEDKFNICFGYFQREHYFAHMREHILECFAPRDEMISEECNDWLTKIRSKESVSVHIRRGDFVNIGLSLPVDYYRSAIELMNKLILEKNSVDEKPEYFVFSDDIDWCREHFRTLDCHYIKLQDNNADINEMYLMSKCRHNIIANSTYSWWGAWLNRNDEKIVIAPKQGISQDVIPSEWIKL